MIARALDDDDDGFSLIELIFYVVILGLITTGIAVMFFNMWIAQASVTDQSAATGRGQLVSAQIEKAMRNAIAFEVTDEGFTSGLAQGPVLIVATGLVGTQACVAFDLANGDAQLISTSGSAVSTPPWPIWQEGIVPRGSTPFFTEVGEAVNYSFDATSHDGPTVHFQGTAYMRNPSGGTHTCF